MYPQTGLTDGFTKYRKQKPSVTLAVNRRVVSPVLFRNSEPDRAETHEFDGTLHAQVNPEKFISSERMSGLHLLRYLSDKFAELESWSEDTIPEGLISSDHAYNEPGDLVQTVNMDTLTYGAAGTGDETYSLKSHVVAGYSYSMEPYDLVDKEVRNAVYESGTMRDSEGEQSSSLYNLVPVRPGNSFVNFVTLEAGTPEMLLYVMYNILNTSSYGARETRNAKNLENEILAVITSPHPVTLSSGELLMDYHSDGDSTEDSVERYIDAARDDHWNVYSETLGFDDPPDWYSSLLSTARLNEGDEIVFDELQGLTQSAYETLVHVE